jgi:hypothetical protein
MIEDGGSLKSFRLVCKPAQNESPGTTDPFGIGILLVHSATECGDQIVQLFLSAHDPPLSRFFAARLVSIATRVALSALLYMTFRWRKAI